MPTPAVHEEVSRQRKAAIEAALRDGFAPFRTSGGKGSSLNEAARRLGMRANTLQSWVLSQDQLAKDDKPNFLPDWSLWTPTDAAAAPWPPRVDGFTVREVTTAYDGEGKVDGEWVRAGPEPVLGHGGELEGPARDGFDGWKVKGVSTYYDASGAVRGQWVKTNEDRAHAETHLRRFVEWLVQDAKGLAPLVAAPVFTNEDLLAVYPVGDPHFGMYAWAEEAGEDFDLDIAQEVTFAAVDRLVSAAPAAHQALFLNLGDFFHGDNAKNQTPESGHALDIDSRHAKVMQVGLRAVVHCVNRLKERHQIVHGWMMPGNHDPMTSFALALALDAFFSNDARVKIDLSPSLYKYMRFGANLIGAHHGHGAKMVELPGIMATDCAEDWGETSFRTWYCGHIHHKTKDKEHPGCMVESFNTLAPGDAWHAGKGYRAARNMQCIVHHRSDGEIERHTFNVPRSRRRRVVAA